MERFGLVISHYKIILHKRACFNVEASNVSSHYEIFRHGIRISSRTVIVQVVLVA